MAKKNKPELTLEELQAKKSRRQRGWVRFCAIVLAVALTAGIYGFASSGDPHTVPLYSPAAQQVVVQNSSGDTTDTPTTPAGTPSTTTPSGDSGSDSSSGGGILDMLMGLLGNIDLSSLAGMLDLEGLGITIADGIDSLQSSLISLLDRIEESFTGQPAITHDPEEYDFVGEVGDAEARAQIAQILNDATSNAALDAYTFNRTASFTPDGHASVGAQTEMLDQILSAANLSLDSIVGDFVDVGTISQRYSADTLAAIQEAGQANYLLKTTDLTADDIQIVSSNVTSEAYQSYTIRLKNVDNPNRAGATGLSRFTDDYLVQNEVEDVIANAINLAGTSISVLKLTDLEMSYSDITVQFVYNGTTDQLQSLSYSYKAYGKFTVRTNTVQIVGDATTQVTNNFSNFSYADLVPVG